MTSETLLTLGIFVIATIAAMWIVAIWRLLSGSHKSVFLDGDGSLSDHFGFAAIDVHKATEVEIAQATKACADVAEEIVPYIAKIKNAICSIGTKRVVTEDGSVFDFAGIQFDDKFSLKFCLGDSLTGLGIIQKSVLITLEIDGIQLQKAIDEWQNTNSLSEKSIIHSNGYIVDLSKNTLTLPNGVIVRKGNIMSLVMASDVRSKYVEEFRSRDAIKSFLADPSAEHIDEMLSKIRIFGGFSTDHSKEIANISIKCFRFPPGYTEPVPGSSTHPIEKLNGFVVESMLFDEAMFLGNPQYQIAA